MQTNSGLSEPLTLLALVYTLLKYCSVTLTLNRQIKVPLIGLKT